MSIQKHFERCTVCYGKEHMEGGITIARVAAWLVRLHLCLESKEWTEVGLGYEASNFSPSDQFPPGVHSPKDSATLPNSTVSQLVTKMFKCLWHSHSNRDRGWDRFGVSLGYILRSAQKPTHRIEEKGLPCSIIILTKYFRDAKDFV